MKKYLYLALIPFVAFGAECESKVEAEEIKDQLVISTDVPPPSSGESSGTCSVKNLNITSNAYRVQTTGTILNSSGKLEITLIGNATVTGHNYSGGGATTSTSGGVYTFKPNAGVATDFLIYKNANGSFGTAKVTDGNGVVTNCTVVN